MKPTLVMAETKNSENEQFERYTPKNPLPAEIQKMERDETVCKYCGVSYLIHNEIKALEEKLKIVEAELEHYKGCEERENQLKEEVTQLQEEKAGLKRNLEAKEILIATLRNNIKNEEELTKENQQMQIKIAAAMQLKEEYRKKNVEYQKSLRAIKENLAKERTELSNIHAFIEQRDQLMSTEVQTLLADVKEKCSSQENENKRLLDQLNSLETERSESSVLLMALKEKVRLHEGELKNMSLIKTENSQLQHKVSQLEASLADLQGEVDESVSKNRHLSLECQQFKEQLKNKTKEVEDLTSQFRRKDQNTEMTMQKLQSDLRQKESELQSRVKELKNLENQFQEQRRKEEEIHRKATLTVSETRELKKSLESAKEEIEQLKSEREVMITSHQNRIEQLRESFKQKIAEAENWPEKLQEALNKERKKNAMQLKAMEEQLKENFVMEMNIEKEKYQELLKKYQNSNKDHETKLKQQLSSIESKYKEEIKDLQQMIADNRIQAKETEEALRREIKSLKAIIQDLENRLARLDSGNDDVISQIKTQLKETHQELQECKEELVAKENQVETIKKEVLFLQDTVRNECEERFELTEKLSEAKEELLKLKRPAGGYNSTNSSRHSSALGPSSQVKRSNSLTDMNTAKPPKPNTDTDITEKQKAPVMSPDVRVPPAHPPTSQPPAAREYTTSASSTVSYKGENAKQPGKLKGNSLESTRKRIAAMLGRNK